MANTVTMKKYIPDNVPYGFKADVFRTQFSVLGFMEVVIDVYTFVGKSQCIARHIISFEGFKRLYDKQAFVNDKIVTLSHKLAYGLNNELKEVK